MHVCDMPTSSSNVGSQEHTGKHLLRLSSSQFDPEETLWCHRPLILPRSRSPVRRVSAPQEPWNRSVPTHVRHAGRPCCKRLLRAHNRCGHGAWFENNRCLAVSLGAATALCCQEVHQCRGSADGPHRKITTGVGPLPIGSSSGQSGRPIAHIIGESHAVLVSCLRH